jgi:hypothetical protein
MEQTNTTPDVWKCQTFRRYQAPGFWCQETDDGLQISERTDGREQRTDDRRLMTEDIEVGGRNMEVGKTWRRAGSILRVSFLIIQATAGLTPDTGHLHSATTLYGRFGQGFFVRNVAGDWGFKDQGLPLRPVHIISHHIEHKRQYVMDRDSGLRVG